MRIPHLFLFLLLGCLPLSAGPSDSTTVLPDPAVRCDTTANGLLMHTRWYSHSEQIFRRVDIYLPNGHAADAPIVYLLHGINGYEGAWQRRGRAIDILDSLIAEGACPTVALVMPDCNKWPFKEVQTHGNLWKSIVRYRRLSREHEIDHAISDLMDRIDTMMYVSRVNYIAGLSDGARIAANVANLRPECLQAVGLFSPVLHKDQLPKDSTQFYAIYAGTSDIFYPNGKRFHKRLTQSGQPHRWTEMRGNHNWRMWQKCLADFLKNLPQQ